MPLWLFQCRDQKQATDALAHIGPRFVTVNEFIQRAELSPPPDFHTVNGYSGNRALMELLIGEKLLANEAEALHLESTAAFQEWRAYTENLAIAKQLYREEILNKIALRAGEIDSSVARAKVAMRIKFFQSSERAEAERFAQLAKDCQSFDRALQIFFGRAIPEKNYTSRFTFGDADEQLENAVFALPLAQVSEVLPSSRGFFVVELSAREPHQAFVQLNNAHQRAQVQKILRTRKAGERSAQFVRRFMQDRSVVLKGKAFSILVNALARHIDFESSAAMPALRALTEANYDQTMEQLHNYLDEPLIVFAGGHWSMRTTLEKLRLRNLPFNRQSPQAMRQTLENDLQMLVRDEFLAAEGRRRGLANHVSVQEEVRIWVDHHLYVRMVQRLSLQPQKTAIVRFPPAVDSLKQKYPVIVFEEKLQTIELTGIKMIGVHADRPQHLAVPLWPLF